MKKRLFILAAVCATSVLAFSSYQKQDNPAGKRPPFKGFKNLTVLPKDISPDSLHQLMEVYNQALGVSCNFCHAKDDATGKLDFASDAKKEKGFARDMITMTKRINEKDFSFVNPNHPDQVNIVKCGTCHRGSAEPTEYAPEGKD